MIQIFFTRFETLNDYLTTNSNPFPLYFCFICLLVTTKSLLCFGAKRIENNKIYISQMNIYQFKSNSANAFTLDYKNITI